MNFILIVTINLLAILLFHFTIIKCLLLTLYFPYLSFKNFFTVQFDIYQHPRISLLFSDSMLIFMFTMLIFVVDIFLLSIHFLVNVIHFRVSIYSMNLHIILKNFSINFIKCPHFLQTSQSFIIINYYYFQDFQCTTFNLIIGQLEMTVCLKNFRFTVHIIKFIAVDFMFMKMKNYFI